MVPIDLQLPRTRTRTRSVVPTGACAVLLAALAWSTNGLALAALPAGASPVTFAAVRMLAGGALLLAAGQVLGRSATSQRGRAVGWGRLAAAAAVMAGYQALYFTAMQLAGVAVGTVVQMASVPMFVGLFTVATTRSWPRRAWWAATGCAAAGTGVMLVAGGHRGISVAGVGCALGPDREHAHPGRAGRGGCDRNCAAA